VKIFFIKTYFLNQNSPENIVEVMILRTIDRCIVKLAHGGELGIKIAVLQQQSAVVGMTNMS
jgi:hypothetical protein